MKQLPDFTVLKGFIVFEGLDGAGTTTQSRLLCENFRKTATPCFLTCEPTESFIGRTVRSVLQKRETVGPGTLARLFSADRNDHLYHPENGILEQLKKGLIVVCDRYLFSSLAYQSIDWDFDDVWELNCSFPLPEHLLFLDVNPEESQRRILERDAPQEIYEKKDLQDKIRSNYFDAFQHFEGTRMDLHVFDGTLPVQELQNMIWKQLKPSDTRV